MFIVYVEILSRLCEITLVVYMKKIYVYAIKWMSTWNHVTVYVIKINIYVININVYMKSCEIELFIMPTTYVVVINVYVK